MLSRIPSINISLNTKWEFIFCITVVETVVGLLDVVGEVELLDFV